MNNEQILIEAIDNRKLVNFIYEEQPIFTPPPPPPPNPPPPFPPLPPCQQSLHRSYSPCSLTFPLSLCDISWTLSIYQIAKNHLFPYTYPLNRN